MYILFANLITIFIETSECWVNKFCNYKTYNFIGRAFLSSEH